MEWLSSSSAAHQAPVGLQELVRHMTPLKADQYREGSMWENMEQWCENYGKWWNMSENDGWNMDKSW